MERQAGHGDVFPRDDVAFGVRRGKGLGRVSVHGEPAENELGLALRHRQLSKRFPFPMTSLAMRELKNRTAPILDCADFDFVLSVGVDDVLAHDFWLGCQLRVMQTK